MFDAAALRARQVQWDRFHAWEDEHPYFFASLQEAWEWYEEMFEVACQTGAISPTPQIDMGKITRLREERARLARLRWPS